MIPGNPAVGSTVLRIPAIQSPDFIHGVSGWAIRSDGTAEFHSISIPAGSGGTVVTFAASAPLSPNVGDVWYDTSDGMLAHQWDGAAWVPYLISSGGIATGGILPGNIANLDSSLIGHVGVLNPNPYFIAGDGTGYAAISAITLAPDGTFSVVSGAGLPSGAPYAFAGKITGTSDTFGVMAEQNGPFTAVVGQQYQISAWVNCQNTQVALGFLWADGSVDVNFVTVPANTWTQVSTVITGSVAGPAFEFAGSLSTTADLYVQALLVLNQVPGGLIQAGTIEAVQMAAGIVVAGIVDATVITGGTLIADAANGGVFDYSAAPALGNLTATMVPQAGTDLVTNPYVGGLAAYANSGGTNVGAVQINASGGFGAITWLGPASGGYVNQAQINVASSTMTIDSSQAPGALPMVLTAGAKTITLSSPVTASAAITATAGTSSAPTVITTDTWHTVAPPTNTSGTLRYRLMPDKTVMVEVQLTVTSSAAAGTLALITGLAAAYTPGTQQRGSVGFVVNGSPTVAQLAADCGMRWQANTGGSFNVLGFTGGAANSGVVELSFNARYSVD